MYLLLVEMMARNTCKCHWSVTHGTALAVLQSCGLPVGTSDSVVLSWQCHGAPRAATLSLLSQLESFRKLYYVRV